MARQVLEVSPAFLDLKLYVPSGGVSWQPVFTCQKLDTDGEPFDPPQFYDFTNASAVMYVKDKKSGTVLDTLSSATSGTGANRLLLGDADGTLQMVYPKSVTVAYAFGDAAFDSAVYDLSVTDDDGNETPFFAGNFIVVPGV